MKESLQYIICGLIYLSISSRVYAQQYVIKNYGVSEGLGQSQVQAIAQDSLGYLWVGTMGGGISRFDGTNFVNYARKNGLASNFVVSIQVIDRETILVGTKSGLSKITSDSIYSNFTNSPLDSLIIQDIKLPYIATSSGLFIYQNNTVIPFDKKASKCGRGIYQLAFNSRGMWGATNHGIVEYNDSSASCRTDLNRVHNNYFMSVVSDHNEAVWAGSLGGGVTQLLSNGKLKYYSKKAGLKTYDVSCLFVDDKNNLWIGSKGQGVSKFDGQYFTQITTKNGLANDFVNTIFQDKNGIIWFGTSNGVSKYEGDKYVLYDNTSLLPGGGGYSVCQDDKSTWFGTFDGGVIRKVDKSIKRYSGKNRFTSKRVRTITKDKQGKLWFGSDGGGAFVFQNKTFSKLPFGNVWVRDIQHRDSIHYLATLGNGLIVKKGDTIQNYLVEHGLPSNRINRIIIDTVVWLATDKGLCYLKQDSIYKVKELQNRRFTSFAKTKDGSFYLGNIGGGMMVYKNNEVSYLNSNNGLNSDNIYALFAEENKLWVGTEKGLDELIFDENSKLISNKKHTINEGFLGIELLRNSIWKDSTQQYWFGTVNGMVRYTPSEKIKTDSLSTNLMLESVELFYEPLATNKLLSKTLTLANNEFSYQENHFTFRFRGIDLISNHPLVYQWKLKGFDDIWSTPTTQNFATYANLLPGEYQFEVRVKGDDEIWSKSLTIDVVILQPYWKSTWFLVLMIVLGVLVLGGIAWSIVNRINKKNTERNKQLVVDRRLIELEQQALRLQMNPHFLFNSLNAIKGAVAQQQTKEAKRSIDQFAKLMRAMLDNTKEGFIPLNKEINLIEQYLGLELLNHSFEFNITIGEDVNEDCLIPAMMIQPLVENAVLHGVSPLQKNGEIRIKFIKLSEGVLSCIIEDNGIGIEASKQAKEQSVHKQESKAMHIIKSRLSLIQKENNQIGLVIKDGEQNGTIVTLNLPIKY